MAYAVVRTDNMFGTDVRAGLVSIKYVKETTVDETTTKEELAIENGHVLKVGELMEGEREIFEGGDVAKADDLSDIVLVSTPEMMYDERKKNLDEFINEAGRPCRGYHLHNGDIFSLTREAFTGEGTPKVGDVVELADGTQLKFVTEGTSGSTEVGRIIAVENAGRYTYYVIKVNETPIAKAG